jgi:hypothetical protein
MKTNDLRAADISKTAALIRHLPGAEYAKILKAIDSIGSYFPFGEKMGLELTDVLRTQLVGGAVEIASKIFKCVDIAFFRGLSVVTAQEFFEHHLA